jgi:hypothetical protein
LGFKSQKEDKMAKVEPKDGKYNLGGSKDSDLEGIDAKKYDVFTEGEKLAEAKIRYPSYNWFISFTIKDKSGKDVRDMPEYTIKFDKPNTESFQFYYYLDGTAHPFPHEDTDNKGNKKRVKAKLTVGDPPGGTVP